MLKSHLTANLTGYYLESKLETNVTNVQLKRLKTPSLFKYGFYAIFWDANIIALSKYPRSLFNVTFILLC